MFSEKRRSSRHDCSIGIELSLRNGVGGTLLAGPVPATIVDYSSQGMRLRLQQIHVDKHHFFFEAQDCDAVLLHAELIEEAAPVSLPLRPRWFDRDLYDDEGVKPFLLGVELLDESGTDAKLLLRIADRLQDD